MNPQRRSLLENPRRAIESARHGSLGEVTALASFWQDIPDMISLGVLDVFYRHLDESKAPSPTGNLSQPNRYTDLAFMSLLGLSKLSNYPASIPSLEGSLVKAWPGIFKWSRFFFNARVIRPDVDEGKRRDGIDVLSSCWYAISRSPRVHQAMVNTPGVIEIIAQLWIREDSGTIPSSSYVPLGSLLLNAILTLPDEKTLDKLVKAAGGSASNVAKLALSRLRSASKGLPIEAERLAVLTDVINKLSYNPNHRLQYALLDGNAITLVTKNLVTTSKEIVTSRDSSLLEAMVSSFGYLRNFTEATEGFIWVTQSIDAGLLYAFVDCSPSFSRLDPEGRTMVLSIVKDLIPRYLVYRSVITAAEGCMSKIQGSNMKDRVMSSVAKDIWNDLYSLVRERHAVMRHNSETRKIKGATCDNVKCNKTDSKNNFRKCSACLVTLYCSKECQAVAWKEGDHKTVCKLKQRERLEGKRQPLSKSDRQFIHHLNMRDAHHHVPLLQSTAQSKFPGVPLSSLMISIDYTNIPPTFTMKTLTDYSIPPTSGSRNAEARSDSLIERMKENPDKGTLIEAIISGGRSRQMVLTVCPGTLDKWKSDTELTGGTQNDFGDAGYESEDDGPTGD